MGLPRLGGNECDIGPLQIPRQKPRCGAQDKIQNEKGEVGPGNQGFNALGEDPAGSQQIYQKRTNHRKGRGRQENVEKEKVLVCVQILMKKIKYKFESN